MPKRYPEEFKQQAVSFVRDEGRSVAHVAREMGVSASGLRGWVAQADGKSSTREDGESNGAPRSSPVDARQVDRSPLLEVESVDFSYGRQQVLFGISVVVRTGEMLALLGTNGAGKSTLLRVICGVHEPDAGRVVFEGHDLSGEPPERRVDRGLCLVPGDGGVFADMTVADNLEVGAYLVRKRDPRRWRRRRALALETFPRLAQRLRQRAGSLSGGEQQQLALARAIMFEPKLLCIDELSLGLAPVVLETLLTSVRDINEAGTTIVLVEQSLNVAASLCSRAVFLEKGSVRFEGETAELLERDDVARAVFFGESRDRT